MRVADWLPDGQSMTGDDMPTRGNFSRYLPNRNDPGDTSEPASGGDKPEAIARPRNICTSCRPGGVQSETLPASSANQLPTVT